MSASLYYQPVKGTHLSIGAPSSFMGALTRAFGERQPDWRFTEGDLLTLRGLMAGLDSEDQREAIQTIIEAIERHSEVRVWAEY
jgi:hypothetical protein